jgi:hypothetical protein
MGGLQVVTHVTSDPVPLGALRTVGSAHALVQSGRRRAAEPLWGELMFIYCTASSARGLLGGLRCVRRSSRRGIHRGWPHQLPFDLSETPPPPFTQVPAPPLLSTLKRFSCGKSVLDRRMRGTASPSRHCSCAVALVPSRHHQSY